MVVLFLPINIPLLQTATLIIAVLLNLEVLFIIMDQYVQTLRIVTTPIVIRKMMLLSNI